MLKIPKLMRVSISILRFGAAFVWTCLTPILQEGQDVWDEDEVDDDDDIEVRKGPRARAVFIILNCLLQLVQSIKAVDYAELKESDQVD